MLQAARLLGERSLEGRQILPGSFDDGGELDLLS